MYLKVNDEISFIYKITKYMEDETGKYCVCFILYGDEKKAFSFNSEKERDDFFNIIKKDSRKITMVGNDSYELYE